MLKYLALVGLWMGTLVGSANAACLQAWPSVVPLSGVLERITYPGPPNYESTRSGDEPMPYFVLRLTHAVCIVDATQGKISSKDLQLLLAPEQYAQYRPRLGTRITLQGQLWPAETASHHTPLMFKPASHQDGR